MYLAKLRLDPSKPLLRRDLADAYEMHRTLSRAFALSEDQAPGRFLWRLESEATALSMANAIVLVQSALPGNWPAITESHGYALEGSKSVELDALLRSGRHCRFRLKANPTVTRDGKRYGLVGETALQGWLARQGDRCGFAVQEVVTASPARQTMRQGKRGERITIDTARFDGLLEITDVSALRAALLTGIGHGKAFGLGMLSLAPARS